MPALCSHPIMGLPRHRKLLSRGFPVGGLGFWSTYSTRMIIFKFTFISTDKRLPNPDISGRMGEGERWCKFPLSVSVFRLSPPLYHSSTAFPLLSNVCILGERISVYLTDVKGSRRPGGKWRRQRDRLAHIPESKRGMKSQTEI